MRAALRVDCNTRSTGTKISILSLGTEIPHVCQTADGSSLSRVWRPLLDPDTRRLGSEVLAKLRGDAASPPRLSGALLSKPGPARPDDSHPSLPPHTHPPASSPSDRRAKERGEEGASEGGGGACGGGGVASGASPTKPTGPPALLPI